MGLLDDQRPVLIEKSEDGHSLCLLNELKGISTYTTNSSIESGEGYELRSLIRICAAFAQETNHFFRCSLCCRNG